LTQPFFTTEPFTNLKGKLVSLKDALDGCERILRDEFKDYPESAFYMIGTVDEAKEKAKSAKPAAKAEDKSKTKTDNEMKSDVDVKPDLKSKVEVEHAAGSTHGS
jgi:F-type H+-transporting ATPase subunit beta